MIGNWISYSGELWDGLRATLMVTVVASFLTLIWASFVTWLRLSPVRVLRGLAIAYIEVFRGTPIIIQIFAIFTVLPSLGIRLPPFESAIITLVLNAGGYLTENIRSAFRSIPRGLIEVADALGMSPFMKLRRVVIPQSLKVMIPVCANTLLFILLTTPFVFLVGIQELMMKAGSIQRRTGDYTVFLEVAAIYVAIALLIHFAAARLERRLISHF